MSTLRNPEQRSPSSPCVMQSEPPTPTARYQVKPREDGRGPYRWAHVVKTPGGLAKGTIYHQTGHELTADEASELFALCDQHGFELRRVS